MFHQGQIRLLLVRISLHYDVILIITIFITKGLTKGFKQMFNQRFNQRFYYH
jgi:hypothetical protein